MKKTIIILSFLTLIGTLWAVDVQFLYDANGSRTDRIIVPFSKKSYPSEDVIANSKISVYPNPTMGLMKVDITNLSDENTAYITVMEITGRMIWEKTVSGSVEINLSDHATGAYLMNIKIGKETSFWKIIKEE